jgi:hypothetical protein
MTTLSDCGYLATDYIFSPWCYCLNILNELERELIKGSKSGKGHHCFGAVGRPVGTVTASDKSTRHVIVNVIIITRAQGSSITGRAHLFWKKGAFCTSFPKILQYVARIKSGY